MKNKLLSILFAISFPEVTTASIPDVIIDFKTDLIIPDGDKILKWEIDINGDNHKEILLCLKSDFNKEKENHEPQSLDFYIASATEGEYAKPEGIEIRPEVIARILPDIDIEVCFVGEITELGKRGIVTMRTDNPREGESIGKIYAYTIEGDHLKRTELAQYVIVEGPHALFTKYLADGKRTIIQMTEIDP